MNDSDYLKNLQKNAIVKTIGKERVYVEDPSNVPDGASLNEGPKGGLYYETEQVEEFQEEQNERTEAILQRNNFSEGQINEAQKLHDEYTERGDEIFGNIMNIATEAGVEMVGGSYRIKGVGSMLRKAHVRENEYEEVDDLLDVFGCTVKPSSPEEVNEAADAIRETFGEENIIKSENYMKEPQGGYYRAQNIVVETEDGKAAEIQVKSPKLADVASIGHVLVYKNEEAEDVPDVGEDVQEDVRDCLGQLSGTIVGERAEDPDCTQEASSLINEVAEKVQVA